MFEQPLGDTGKTGKPGALQFLRSQRVSHNLADWTHNNNVQFSRSVLSTLSNPTDCSTPGLPVYHQLLEPTQTHVHWVSDAIQPFHPLSSLSAPAFNLSPSGSFPVSQPFTWGGHSIRVSASASVLPMNTQDCSPLGRTGWISLQSKGLSRVFSNTTVQSINSSLLSSLYSPSLTSIHDYWKNHSLD